jgi:CRP-like cAMP-binding protein
MDYHKKFIELYSPVIAFSEKDWRCGSTYFSFHIYQPKEIIFTINDCPKDVYFLIEGIGRYFYIDKNGKERNKGLVNKGGAFASISSLIKGNRSPFYTQTITQCLVAKIQYKNMLKLGEINKNWNMFIRKSYENLALKKEQREASLLMMSATERYQKFLKEFGDESKLIPLKQVAMYIGITDVSLSRIRKKMDLT